MRTDILEEVEMGRDQLGNLLQLWTVEMKQHGNGQNMKKKHLQAAFPKPSPFGLMIGDPSLEQTMCL